MHRARRCAADRRGHRHRAARLPGGGPARRGDAPGGQPARRGHRRAGRGLGDRGSARQRAAGQGAGARADHAGRRAGTVQRAPGDHRSRRAHATWPPRWPKASPRTGRRWPAGSTRRWWCSSTSRRCPRRLRGRLSRSDLAEPGGRARRDAGHHAARHLRRRRRRGGVGAQLRRSDCRGKCCSTALLARYRSTSARCRRLIWTPSPNSSNRGASSCWAWSSSSAPARRPRWRRSPPSVVGHHRPTRLRPLGAARSHRRHPGVWSGRGDAGVGPHRDRPGPPGRRGLRRGSRRHL